LRKVFSSSIPPPLSNLLKWMLRILFTSLKTDKERIVKGRNLIYQNRWEKTIICLIG